MQLTARQAVELSKVIRKRCITDQYNQMAFHAKLAGAELPPLDQFLELCSNEGLPAKESAQLDRHAEALYAKRMRENGR